MYLGYESFYGLLPTWGLVLQFLGAIIIAVCYAPGTFQSLRDRQTQDMSWNMWYLTVFALTCLAIFAACGVASDPGAQFAVVFCSETICDIFAILILFVKAQNCAKAKRLGITERELCEKFKAEHPEKFKKSAKAA